MRILNLSPDEVIEACPSARDLDPISKSFLIQLGQSLTYEEVFKEKKFPLYFGDSHFWVPKIIKDVFLPLGIETSDCDALVETMLMIDPFDNTPRSETGISILTTMINCFIGYSLPYVSGNLIQKNTKLNIISNNSIIEELVILTDSEILQNKFEIHSFSPNDIKLRIPQFIGYYMDNKDNE